MGIYHDYNKSVVPNGQISHNYRIFNNELIYEDDSAEDLGFTATGFVK